MPESSRDFREFYEQLANYEGSSLYKDVLDQWLQPAASALQALAPYRLLNTAENSYPVEDLFQWFALNVANDFLLWSFQETSSFYQAPPGAAKQKHDKYIIDALVRSGHADIVNNALQSKPSALDVSEYIRFYEQLGFEAYTMGPFTPFHYEIVEVIEDPQWTDEPAVEHVYWPGLKFGQMLFSRAGVRVRCRREIFAKEIAENSTLYFTNRRHRRPVEDLSHGWGSGSRWATDFRRDYETDTHFHYNVDGDYTLGSKGRHSPGSSKHHDMVTLTLAEQIELLTHRCFVQCTKDDTNRWPYDDRLSIPK